jgi:glucose/arabinose dehydrogenase
MAPARRSLLRSIPALALALAAAARAVPPAPFVTDSVGGAFQELVGAAPLPDGRVLAWERTGVVWLIRADGSRQPEAVLDLRGEVGAWRDHGMLGLAVDPRFPAVPDVHVLYVVDRHHLTRFGTPAYDPATDEYFAATIGRVVRFALVQSGTALVAEPASRRVLVGESITTGLPVCHQSHAVGSLVFGRDGTLLVSMGDSASYFGTDAGGQVSGGYVTQALADGILKPKENVGAFRAQLVDTLAGKVLRIDPATGDGVPGNPWFDAAAPRAARSRVWALGLRNPFRMSLLPGTGSADPAAADPGTLVVGDVGWNAWEELSLVTGPGRNLGWPLFEGLEHQGSYAGNATANPDATVPGCAGVPFRELIRQDSQRSPRFIASCKVLQAESATGQNAPAASTEHGFTGSGYRDFAETSDAWIEWTVTVPSTGTHVIAVRFANGSSADRPLDLLVDGAVRQAGLSFPASGSWREWSVATAAPIQLTAGAHVMRLRPAASNGPNVDALWLEGSGASVDLPTGIPAFTHLRPIVDWRHGTASARTRGFNAAGAAVAVPVGTAGAAQGAQFGGFCALGAPRADFAGWPEAWRGTHFMADYTEGWIRAARIGADGRLESVQPFDAGLQNLAGIFADEVNECLWLPRFSTLERMRIPPACAGDLNADGSVDGIDLGMLLSRWGGGGAADLDRNGAIDGADLGVMLGNWGSCAG